MSRIALDRQDSLESSGKPFVTACLVGLALALLLVGLASGTFLRHVVQIVPIVLVLVVVPRRPAWAGYSALPIFVFWMAIVTLIWLFLLGVSRVANGRYTPIEIVLTFVIAACSVVGVFKSVSLGRPLPAIGRLVAFLLFTVVQVAAMWVSFLRPIANR